MNDLRKQIHKARRIVIKIGSSLLVDGKGNVSTKHINRFVELVDRLNQDGREVVLVSSGAVAASRQFRQLKGLELCSSSSEEYQKNHFTLKEKQAWSSVGQIYLMEKYRRAFLKKKRLVAQILMSKFSINHRASYLNARNTINELLAMKIVPIINENDPLATDEFCFGENDILGALTCGLVGADLYLIFSNVDGVYKNFGKTKGQDSKGKFKKGFKKEVYPLISNFSHQIFSQINTHSSAMGSGGMLAKMEAARMASEFKVYTLIMNGRKNHLYDDLFNSNAGTLVATFAPHEKVFNAKKKWLASNVTPKASIVIDEGAARAINNRKSLLPSGVVEVKGKLEEGDICNLLVETETGRSNVIARGLSNYNKKDLLIIKGCRTSEIEKVLGRSAHSEVIHSDNLVVLSNEGDIMS